MSVNVTAILVAKDGGPALTATLDALAAQTLAPTRQVIIVLGESQDTMGQLSSRGLSNVLVSKAKASYGAALALAVKASAPLLTPDSDGIEWLWLLPEDAAPEPDALEKLMQEINRTGSATVAGPKLIDWHDPQQLIELGQGLTWAGSRWRLDNQELDQQQYDHIEDTLGVGSVGMLVRRDVWQKLGGFDPALPVFDDGLDFSVRARLAGYRVIVVPSARVRYARSGVAGPKWGRRQSLFKRSHRIARTAALHRRIKYAHAPLALLWWIALPLIGVLGMLWALVRGRPGTMIGELRAALNVFFHPGRIMRARAIIRRQKTTSWRSLRSLRTDRKTVRNVRAVRKEAILVSLGRERKELNFISTGGLALTASMLVLSVALTWWLLGASFVNGGGAAPLGKIGQIWANTVGAFPQTLSDVADFGGATPADPLNWVIAVFASLTFFNPSLIVVLLLILATPAAALGGWMWGAKLTNNAAARVLSGVLWGIGPMLLAAITTGRINSVILAVILPWVLVSLSNAHKTWSWAATAALLTAAALATAPVLIPAAVIIWIAAILAKPNRIAQTILLAIPTAILFAPLVLRAWATGQPLGALIDPGLSQPYSPADPWQMMLGFPSLGFDGWAEWISTLGLDSGQLNLTMALMLAPLAALAVTGLFGGHPRVTSLTALAGALGLVTALLSPQIILTPHADGLVAVWAGSGLTLYWAAISTLAVLGLPMLRRASVPVAIVTMLGVALIVAPSLTRMVTNNVEVRADEQQLPAVALAEAQINPKSRTVFITTMAANDINTQIVTGPAITLDSLKTAATLAPVTELETEIAELIGDLAGVGGDNTEQRLLDANISAIVLRPPTTDGMGLHAQLQSAFDQQSELIPVGETAKGMLWRVAGQELGGAGGRDAVEEAVADEQASSFGETTAATSNTVVKTTNLGVALQEASPNSRTVWIIQLAVLLGIFLLALPMAEVRYKPQRRRRVRRAPVGIAEGTAPSPSESFTKEDAISAGEVNAGETDTGKTDVTNEEYEDDEESELPAEAKPDPLMHFEQPSDYDAPTGFDPLDSDLTHISYETIGDEDGHRNTQEEGENR